MSGNGISFNTIVCLTWRYPCNPSQYSYCLCLLSNYFHGNWKLSS